MKHWFTIAVLFLGTSTTIRAEFSVFLWLPIFLLLAMMLYQNLRNLEVTFEGVLFIAFSGLILINGFVAVDSLNTVFRGGKFLIIGLLIIFLYNMKSKEKLALDFIILSVSLNFLVLLLAFLFGGSFGRLGGGGRWETLLNSPGGLYLSGLLYIVFFMDLVFRKDRKVSFVNILFLIMSFTLIIFDGSRTAVVFLTLAFLIYFIRYSSILATSKLIFGVGILATVFITTGIIKKEQVAFERFELLLNVQSISEVDNHRYQLLQEGVEYIANEVPIIVGKGFSSIQNSIGNDTQGIHNAYIQVFVELGLLAVLCLLTILFYPVVNILRNFLQSPEYTMIFIFSLIIPIKYLFHPISTEYGDWVPYFICLTLYWSKNEPRYYNSK